MEQGCEITSLKDAIRKFFNDEALYVEPEENDRGWIHDMIHTLFRLNGSARNEMIVGIYQAVLTRSTEVSIKKGALCDGGVDLSWSDIVISNKNRICYGYV